MSEDAIDFEKYRSQGNGELLPGEEGMPEGDVDEEVEPELNQNLLSMVLQMGIPENPAKHALYKTGNADADAAVTWYFENMADESINLPLKVKKNAGNAGGAA